MCSHYESASAERIREAFGVTPDLPFKTELWPTYEGAFIRARREESNEDDSSEYEALTGQFGLLPFWAKDRTLGRRTFNARSETADSKPSFRSAWKNAQLCVIPAESIYEPDWRSGKSVPTRITRTDGGLLSVAGLWEEWRGADGALVHSYSMLTINADDHMMQNYHKPKDEKRMVVILPSGLINDWLIASTDQIQDFMRQYPEDRLMAEPRPA
jgi:putative SOS response-associated peptidase YedK